MSEAEIFTVGVTGTNGKTSTTRWIAATLGRLGRPVARRDTLGSALDREPLALPDTHAGFLALMDACRARGGRFAAVEVTSGALACGFARAWPFAMGVFTNLTRDHLDYHGTVDHYLESKAQLFANLLPGGTAVLNGCDPAAPYLARRVPRGRRIWRYGVTGRTPATALEVAGDVVDVGWEGTRIAIAPGGPLGGAVAELRIRAVGEHFADDAVAALAAGVAAGVPPDEARAQIEATDPPPGRFHVVGHAPHVVVDYAHTPDALRRTLAVARRLCRGALWVVLGAGGDRDAGKRGPMGEAAAAAEHAVLTTDNPRSEDPGAIVQEIRRGIGARCRVEVELDRETAIRRTVSRAAEDDVVVIAGKGHEDLQEIGAVRVPFSDLAVAAACAAERAGRGG